MFLAGNLDNFFLEKTMKPIAFPGTPNKINKIGTKYMQKNDIFLFIKSICFRDVKK